MNHLSRRRFLMGAAGFGLAFDAFQNECPGQRRKSPTEKTPAELITPATRAAIDKGLAYLAGRQIKTGRFAGAFGPSGYQAGTAVCALSGLAFMCAGNAPGSGQYGEHIERCVDYLLSNTQDTGYISAGGHDNMYGHGFAMLFLAQAYGMTQRADIGEKLRMAVKLTCGCQNHEGGWRYKPQPSDADVSITICQIMGLRGARDAGIHVADEVRTKCIAYVKKCQTSDGGFQYKTSGGRKSLALTSAGLVSLYSAGIYDTPEIEKGLGYIMKQLPGTTSVQASRMNYYYAHYYSVQATWHAGGEYWEKWYPAVRDELLSKRSSDGTWPDRRVGPEYATAMCCIILQMPNNYVPAFTS